MESILGDPLSSLTWQKLTLHAFRVCLLLPFLVFLFHVFRKRKAMRDAMDRLPTYKVRFFNFLGHMSFLFNHYLFRYPAPFFAYHSILMTGMTQVYGTEGIFLVWQMWRPAVIVFRAESVELILSHSTELKKAWFYDFFHPWLGEGLLTSEGTKWRPRRKLLTSAFHFNILKDFLSVFNKQSRILVSILQDRKCVDIVPLITSCSFDIICETILGEEMHSQSNEDCDYQKSVVSLTDSLASRVLKPWLWPEALFKLSPTGRAQRHYLRKVKAFADELIARKKREKLGAKPRKLEEEGRKRRALLDLLLDEHIENDSISEEEIREEVDTFTFEGHDTTSMAMSWALFLIGHHPDVQAKIHAELEAIFGDDDRDPTMDDLRDMKYLECVLKEALRLYPSVPGYGRELQQDLEFRGHRIPKGCTCFVWAYALHRDPSVFPNPEVFDPDRFSPENCSGRHPFAYVPFSAGPRNCIGQRFAVLEEKSVLSAVLRRFTMRSLQPRDQVLDTFVVVLRPYGGIRMSFTDRRRH